MAGSPTPGSLSCRAYRPGSGAERSGRRNGAERQAVHAYVANSSRGTWLFPPNQNGGGNRAKFRSTVKREGRLDGVQNSVGLFPKSQRHTHAAAILVEARRRRPMRAYVTAAGIALGLVGMWAALVPFVA